MNFLINLLLSGLAVFVSGRLIPGVMVDSFGTSIVVAIILSIVNAIIKPILVILTLPINIVTLGLFSVVINAVMILLVDAMVSGFSVEGFLTALLFSIVLSVVSTVIYAIVG
jgi:putative membrane protein